MRLPGPWQNALFAREARALLCARWLPWALALCAAAGVGGCAWYLRARAGEASGEALFHGLFSVQAGLLALLGPLLGAESVAGEREARSWDALRLTGLGPAAIARGKLGARLLLVGLFLLALAPAGLLPVLLGGVPAEALPGAWALLALVSAGSLGLGVALGARWQRPRAAYLAAALAGALSFGLLAWLGERAGELWCEHLGRPREGAFWWPLLLAERGLDGGDRARLLGGLAGLAAVGLAGIDALALRCLEEPGEARTRRLERWFLAAGALAVGAGLALRSPEEQGLSPAVVALRRLAMLGALGFGGLALFGGAKGRLRVPAVGAVVAPGLALVAVVGAVLERRWGPAPRVAPEGLALEAAHLAAWLLAGAGLARFVRARWGGGRARLALLAWAALCVGAPALLEAAGAAEPWALARSPFEVFEVAAELGEGLSESESEHAALLWALLDLALGAALWRAARRGEQAKEGAA